MAQRDARLKTWERIVRTTRQATVEQVQDEVRSLRNILMSTWCPHHQNVKMLAWDCSVCFPEAMAAALDHIKHESIVLDELREGVTACHLAFTEPELNRALARVEIAMEKLGRPKP